MRQAPGALEQPLEDPVELVADLAQAVALVGVALERRYQEQRVLLPDQPLDAGEQADVGIACQ